MKEDNKDVVTGDECPSCFGEISGCTVAHCCGAKACHNLSESIRKYRVQNGQ